MELSPETFTSVAGWVIGLLLIIITGKRGDWVWRSQLDQLTAMHERDKEQREKRYAMQLEERDRTYHEAVENWRARYDEKASEAEEWKNLLLTTAELTRRSTRTAEKAVDLAGNS